MSLNLLTAEGEPIELPESLRPAFMGADLRHLRGLASEDGKLALLLTSGASKGRPLAVVARAGYANAIVCDQAAARAALDAID